MITPDVNFISRKRYFVALWCGFGMTLSFVLRLNLSIAIVDMTSEKDFVIENGTTIKKAEYEWDAKVKGFVLSLFSFGFFIAPLGGILSIRYGSVKIFGFGIAVAAILSILSPFLLRIHFVLFALARVLEGVFEGISAASFLNIFILWAPPHERSRLTIIAYMGLYGGTLSSHVLCGFLTQNYGFESVFIVTGGLTIFWYVIWLIFVSNNPLTDRFITETERNYLRTFIQHSTVQRKKTYPWKTMFTSKPVWAIFNEYFCYSWSSSFIINCLPLYIKDIFDVNVQGIGLISAIPVFGGTIGIIISAVIADYLRSRNKFRIATIHRLFIAIGQLSSVSFLLITSLWADFNQSIICLTLMRTFSTPAEVSYQIALMDMFFEYAAMIKGCCLMIGNFGLILNPIVMGFIVADRTRSSWNLYFLFLSAFNIFSLLIFCIFGSGEPQEWAIPKTDGNKDVKRNSESHNADE